MRYEPQNSLHVTLYYWATYGWQKWGKMDNRKSACMFIARYPNKQWKIVEAKELDNFIQ